jgi:hypothetical protein
MAGRLKMWMFGGPSCLMLRSVAFFLVVPRFDRLVLRGQVRCRLRGLSLAQSSAIASRIAATRRRGGKRRLVGGVAADDPQALQKRYPVVVLVDAVRGFVSQLGYRVVSQQ